MDPLSMKTSARLVFDPVAWGGRDVGDNSQFWKPAKIVRTYRSSDGLCVDVRFDHDGRESHGHFLSGVRHV
jgi:hypothetical protein